MEKLDIILKHIEDLYCNEYVDIKKIQEWIEKYPERSKVWQDGLEKYTTFDVLNAIDEYWRFKDGVNKPRLVHIQAILNTSKIDVCETKNIEEQEKLASIAERTKELLRQQMLKKFGE